MKNDASHQRSSATTTVAPALPTPLTAVTVTTTSRLPGMREICTAKPPSTICTSEARHLSMQRGATRFKFSNACFRNDIIVHQNLAMYGNRLPRWILANWRRVHSFENFLRPFFLLFCRCGGCLHLRRAASRRVDLIALHHSAVRGGRGPKDLPNSPFPTVRGANLLQAL